MVSICTQAKPKAARHSRTCVQSTITRYNCGFVLSEFAVFLPGTERQIEKQDDDEGSHF